jgi:hypothetical protein
MKLRISSMSCTNVDLSAYLEMPEKRGKRHRGVSTMFVSGFKEQTCMAFAAQ